jgi:hypothetical protein
MQLKPASGRRRITRRTMLAAAAAIAATPVVAQTPPFLARKCEIGPPTHVKGGLCMSGMFDLAPVRLSWRRSNVSFTDAMEDAMSPQRHIDQ